MKGLIVRNFNWWLGQKMFDRDGILTIGYCYPQMYMAERYNAPGSPYWGMKSFLLLALPDDHPSGLPKPRPCPHWSGSSQCPTPICWCSAGRGG